MTVPTVGRVSQAEECLISDLHGLVPAASHTTWSCWVPGSQVNTDHSDEAFYQPGYIGKASDRIDQNYVSFMFIFLQSLKFQLLFLH